MSINDSNASGWDDVTSRFYDNRPFPKDVKAECMLPADHREMMKDEVYDPINQPSHYTVGPTEVINIIRQQQGSAVEFHYEAALLKYVLRWRYKNGVEDLEKARVYLDWLIEQKKSEQGG
jgi:hypothetical protein